MWSTIILSSGLMLFLGCALTGLILLRTQIRSGVTGFGMLATSDSVLNTAIGATLIGQALYTEDARMKTTCSNSMLLISASTFFLPFASSFISMLIMATECWADKKSDKEKNMSERRVKKTKPKRLTAEIGLQWALPILLIAILHKVDPDMYMAAGFKQAIKNDTCEITRLLPGQMDSECHSNVVTGEEIQKRNNLTVSVIEHIYQLLHGSTDNNESRDESTIYLDPPQTKEEWTSIIGVNQRGGQDDSKREFLLSSRDVCDETCVKSFKTVQTNVLMLLLSIYFIPIIGTAMLHYLSKSIDKQHDAKSIVHLEESSTENLGKKRCHLREIKLISLLNLLMWTPSMLEKLYQNILCSSPPQWLSALLYITGQINTVIRGLINVNAANNNRLLNKNIVVPLGPKPDSSTQDFTASASDNAEILFHKTIK